MEMKVRMEVTRFRNEDVLATSGAVVPPSGVCAHTGMTHILATAVSYNAAANVSTVTGPSFNYIDKGQMQSTGSGLTTVTVAGKVTPGSFIYSNGSSYAICEVQPHAR